jgi:SEC-C motif domain protein
MRSRYAAYVVKNIDYIDATQLNEKHEVFDKAEALKWAESSDWNGLEIKSTKKGQASDDSGLVEFVAHYKDKASGTELKHHETSLFQKSGGEWKFKEGTVHGAQPVKRLEPKLGRNDPCHCGSGKKFKKCHGA